MIDSINSQHWPVGKKLVLVDFETTGFQMEGADRVVELAFICIQDGQIIASDQQLINPRRTIPIHLTEEVHGISNEMVSDSPYFPEASEFLLEHLEDSIFIAHNASFDLRCLLTECLRHNITLPSFHSVDTLKLSKQCISDVPNYKLATLANSLGLDVSSAHRAMADVSMMVGILDHIFLSTNFNATENLINIGGVRLPNVELIPDTSEIVVLGQVMSVGSNYLLFYLDAKGATSEREITVQRIFGNSTTQWIEAYCHLRNEMRSFNSQRINSIISID